MLKLTKVTLAILLLATTLTVLADDEADEQPESQMTEKCKETFPAQTSFDYLSKSVCKISAMHIEENLPSMNDGVNSICMNRGYDKGEIIARSLKPTFEDECYLAYDYVCNSCGE